MDARLEAAQRGLIWLLVVTVIVLLICLPRPGDARTAQAFDELSTFAGAVDLAVVARTRREQAMRFAQVPLAELAPSSVEAPANSKRGRNSHAQGPTWRVETEAPALLALASLRLETLADVSAQSQGAAEADVGTPRVDVVTSALTFRLARMALAGGVTLTGAVLEPAEVGAEQVELVREAERSRQALSDARTSLAVAERKVEIAQKRVDARKKRRSRSTQKFLEQLETANTQREEKAARTQALLEQYEAQAERAVRAVEAVGSAREQDSKDAASAQAPAEIPEYARLRITLKDAQDKVHVIAVAVPIERRKVSMPPLVIPGASSSLPALRASDAWQEVMTLEPTAALTTLRGRLSWQSRSYPLLGVACEGSWLVQVVPCFVALALWFAHKRAVGAATSHRLFGTEVRGNLRHVGFKKRLYELVAVVVLPLSACALAAISLWLLRRPPALPALALFLSFPLALRVYAKLDELRVLNRSITQYHSYPPPPDAIGVGDGLKAGAA